MSLLHAVVLGVVQGLTEFLPISSSAHLRIVPAFLGWADPGAPFTAVTQLGTLAALLVYFRVDLWRIARAWTGGLINPAIRRTLEARLGWYIGLGTIPIAVLGVMFRSEIENGARSLPLIGATLVVFGLLLLAADRLGHRRRGVGTLNTRDAVMIGIAQAAALVPGVSRSGATISAGLLCGLERAAAARYSFLLSVPAVVLSGLFQLRTLNGSGADLTATVVATLLAFVTGYASIALLLRFLAHHSTSPFVVYRVVVGLLVLSLAGAGVIT